MSLVSAPIRASAQSHPLWNELAPGSHEVGFKRDWEQDPYRVWPRSPAVDFLDSSVGRPIRIDIWYVGAAPARGRFLLVVYSAGWFNRAPDNTMLAVYLASHGFVVAAVPQINPGLWTFKFGSDARSVENQIRDLEVAIAVVGGDAGVDRRRIAAMGYSSGGDVALLVQGRNPLVDAVVGLDASWTLGPDNDVISAPFFQPDRHDVPILAARRPIEVPETANQLLDTLMTAPRLIVEIPGGDHGTFSDDPSQRRLLGTGTDKHATTHAVMARIVLEFLTQVLGRDPKAVDGQGPAREFTRQGLVARFRPALTAGEAGR
jgi:dienelactone hydrolase